MNYQKLIIYDSIILFNILNEIKKDLKFDIIYFPKKNFSKDLLLSFKDDLIITNKIISDINNFLLIDKYPIKLSNLIEKVNIELLKKNFNQQSELLIKKYKINLNSRELLSGNKTLKLTEKEISIILYLTKLDTPIRINELQLKVWGYHSDLETHTVETHIYRLRKKILKTFNDNNFIISKKNGYQII